MRDGSGNAGRRDDSPGRETGRDAGRDGLGNTVRDGLGNLVARARSRAGEGAGKLREAAQGLLRSAAFQHAAAAKERGNLEAAFWLLHEEFAAQPEETEVAAAWWDVATALDRVPIAVPAGLLLVRRYAASGDVELAAQYWSELVDAMPDVLAPPAALARILPVLRRRAAEAPEDEAHHARALVQRAMRHAVDPRNEALPVGVALRLFEEGREANPEAARRAAEVALASPDLHDAKRERLQAWMAGEPLEAPAAPPAAAPAAAATADEDDDEASLPVPKPARGTRAASSLSEDQIAAASARLPSAKPVRPASEAPPSRTEPEASADAKPKTPGADEESLALEVVDDESHPEIEVDIELETDAPEPPAFDAAAEAEDVDEVDVEVEAETPARADADADAMIAAAAAATQSATHGGGDVKVLPAVPVALGDEALELRVNGARASRVRWSDVEAVSAVAIGEGESAAPLVDLVLNWSRHGAEPLRVIRLHGGPFDPVALVDGADDPAVALAALLAEILERTRAVPLPDPESALGLRLAAFDDLEAYERAVLRSA